MAVQARSGGRPKVSSIWDFLIYDEKSDIASAKSLPYQMLNGERSQRKKIQQISNIT